MSTVAEKITTLRSLKGAPLSIVHALLFCPTDLALEGWLSSATGYKGNALAVGLADLARMGYVEHPAGKRYGWRLTNAGRQLPLPLDALPQPPGTLEKPESRPVVLDGATLQKPESHSQQGLSASQNPAHFATAADDSGKTRVPGLLTSSGDIDSNASFIPQLLTLLQAAQIYPNARAKLAQQMAERRGAQAVPCGLAWLAYTVAGGAATTKQIGASMFPLLNGDMDPPDEFLPPPDLPFPLALAWALRGGAHPPAPEPAAAPPDPIYADDALDLSPAEQLWRGVLAGLREDLPEQTYTTWCSSTALTAGDAPDSYRVICATPQQRDWVANRLSGHIARHLRRLTGHACTVTFTAP